MSTLLLQTLDKVTLAKELILQGQLVAFPTETVYGLGARVFDEERILALFRAKGRPQDNPLIVHVSSISQVEEMAQEIPPLFYVLAKTFWPGPLTFVLKKQPHISSLVSGGLDSIAIRMPSHPIALQLIKEVGCPLVAPSANLSGRPSPTQASHVMEDLNGLIAAVVEGGDCELGVESTVISLLEEEVILLRPGSITVEAIEEVLGKKIGIAAANSPIRSPGMKYRHYSPDCPVVLVKTQEELEKVVAGANAKWMVLASESFPSTPLCDSFVLSSQTLYTLLRKADREGYAGVVVLYDSVIQQDQALTNRLLKASQVLLI